MNVYDFDDTIYDGDSSVDFFMYYVRVKPSMLKYLPKVIVSLIKYRLGKITVEKMLSDYGPMIKKAVCAASDTKQLVSDFWDKNIDKIKPFYNDVRKDDDVILTASPDILILDIADRLGIKHAVCSKIDETTGDITRLCFRQNKILVLKEEFGDDVQIDDFYTDSMKNDGFFAEHAKRVFLVKGDNISQIK